LGIVPYLVLSELMGYLVQRYGKTLWLGIGFGSFAVLAACAAFVTGYPLLAIFVLWQISGAFMEPVHDLLFFDDVPKNQQSRFYGVFRTSVNLPSVIIPMVGAGVIAVFGATSAVWVVSVFVAAFTLLVLLSERK
jgi:MFS family permease